MATDIFDPSSDSVFLNGLRLWKHILNKGVQLGSVLGLAVVVPATAVMVYKNGGKERFTVEGLGPKLAKAQAVSAAAGLGLSVLAGVLRISQYEDKRDALADRAYRLHYNKGQSRCDLIAQAGMAVGGVGAATLLGSTAVVIVGGASAGAALGVLAHVMTKKT